MIDKGKLLAAIDQVKFDVINPDKCSGRIVPGWSNTAWEFAKLRDRIVKGEFDYESV